MATAKKRTAKRTSAKAKTNGKATKNLAAVRKAFTKSELLNSLAESTGLARKEVNLILEELTSIVERHIKKKAVGQFTIPGLMKIQTVRKPARKARKNVPNPFKPGETMDVAARPAHTVVKIRPLKGLKAMVE